MIEAPAAERVDEDELVLAAAQGDRGAFSALYERHMPQVYRYLRARLGSSTDAEDVTAEVFIKAMGGLRRYKQKGAPFVAWLLRIAHNELVNHVKKRSRRKEVQLDDQDLPSANPIDMALQAVAAEEVQRAMSKLTDRQQQVVALRFGSELSLAEAAEAMGRSTQAVKFLQHSALKALRRAMRLNEEDVWE